MREFYLKPMRSLFNMVKKKIELGKISLRLPRASLRLDAEAVVWLMLEDDQMEETQNGVFNELEFQDIWVLRGLDFNVTFTFLNKDLDSVVGDDYERLREELKWTLTYAEVCSMLLILVKSSDIHCSFGPN